MLVCLHAFVAAPWLCVFCPFRASFAFGPPHLGAGLLCGGALALCCFNAATHLLALLLKLVPLLFKFTPSGLKLAPLLFQFPLGVTESPGLLLDLLRGCGAISFAVCRTVFFCEECAGTE